MCSFIAIFVLGSHAPAMLLADETVSVARWQPHDFYFAAEADVVNPFEIQLSALVSGPDGTSFTIPGFYDGYGTWKVRVAPTSEGGRFLNTNSDVPELNGRTTAFSCVENPVKSTREPDPSVAT